MSEDESFMLGTCAVISLFTWGRWFLLESRVFRPQRARGVEGILDSVSLLCVVLIWVILRSFSSSDVRDSGLYLFFYILMGAAWLGLATVFFPLFNILPRDDLLERRNPAAAYALCGAQIGVSLCFAGGNIGNGPGWWVVVFCAFLSTSALFVLWGICAKITRVMDTITISRDRSAGLRLAGLLAGSGLVLGRSVAGDWTTAGAALHDFLRLGWPAAGIAAWACVFELLFKPTEYEPERPVATHGLLPMLGYIAAGAVTVYFHGPWS